MEKTEELFAAIQQRNAARVCELLADDATLARARNPQGVSALMLARYYSLHEAADAILAAHAEPDVFEAATFGRVERLRDLLDADASRAQARSADSGTALAFACFFAQPEAAKLLLARGADVHAVATGFGNTQPLHSAATSRNLEVVRLVLAAGADPNARQNHGWTPLHSAANHGGVEMVRVLLEHGADPALANDNGQTALDIARAGKHADVIALLEQRARAAG